MIAIEGKWFCKKCKKEMKILYVDVDCVEELTKRSEKYCGSCLPANRIKRLKDITLYNQNREEI